MKLNFLSKKIFCNKEPLDFLSKGQKNTEIRVNLCIVGPELRFRIRPDLVVLVESFANFPLFTPFFSFLPFF